MAAAYVKIYVNKMDDYHLVRTYGGNERDVKHMACTYATFTKEEFTKKHPFYTDDCKDCFNLILVYVKNKSPFKHTILNTPITMKQLKWLIGPTNSTSSKSDQPTVYKFKKRDGKISIRSQYRLFIYGDSNGNIVSKSYTVKDTNSDTVSKAINSFIKEYGTYCTHIYTVKMDIIEINGNMTIRYKDYCILDHGSDKVVLINALSRFIEIIDTFNSIEDALNWIDDKESYLNVLL